MNEFDATIVSKTYPWAGQYWDMSDSKTVWQTCPNCNWRVEIKSTKSPAFENHYDEKHSNKYSWE